MGQSVVAAYQTAESLTGTCTVGFSSMYTCGPYLQYGNAVTTDCSGPST